MKNRFLDVSAYLQNLHAHLRLGLKAMVARSASHSLKNFEKPPWQIPDFSSCLCIRTKLTGIRNYLINLYNCFR